MKWSEVFETYWQSILQAIVDLILKIVHQNAIVVA